MFFTKALVKPKNTDTGFTLTDDYYRKFEEVAAVYLPEYYEVYWPVVKLPDGYLKGENHD